LIQKKIFELKVLINNRQSKHKPSIPLTQQRHRRTTTIESSTLFQSKIADFQLPYNHISHDMISNSQEINQQRKQYYRHYTPSKIINTNHIYSYT
jgi:hypothetical protein